MDLNKDSILNPVGGLQEPEGNQNMYGRTTLCLSLFSHHKDNTSIWCSFSWSFLGLLFQNGGLTTNCTSFHPYNFLELIVKKIKSYKFHSNKGNGEDAINEQETHNILEGRRKKDKPELALDTGVN